MAYLLIGFISASYMSLWVSLGTLIDYYNVRYGPLFFLFLNTSFYAPGLPIAVMQHKMDQKYDMKYGTKATWGFRVIGGMIVLLVCSFLLPLSHSSLAIILTTLTIGIFTWTAHGTLTTITSLYPTRAVSYLQFGFQVPNIYVLGLVMGLGIYGIQDNKIVDYVEGGNSTSIFGFNLSRIERFYFSTSFVILLGLIAGCKISTMRSFLGISDEYERGITGELDSIGGSIEGKDSDEEEPSDIEVPLLLKNTSSSSVSSASDLELENSVLASISLHRKVLFFTIFASIFSGSLFANIPRMSTDDAVNLGQILYFTRLFSDLAGRVVTWLPRKYLVGSIEGLYYIMIFRMLLLVIFVGYIFFPPSLRSDVAITTLVAVCAFQSGYNAVLVYELVGKKVDKNFGGGCLGVDQGCKAKAMATRALNMSFQYACGGACVCNVIAVLGALALTENKI
mmetsp:Transcript_13451/g.27453  ORF Transcript_13451/g.27453 Transcript_13451/m.27453 type:complete len:451 (+) Transcript_13451:158-1510(+)|eukprot:CAMPEP_0118645626 /NCGR_PEP_ID=MMETSP0785-20121206/7606_1 /TAXON_ID=91992 /ORGANISM="Bolidomonas pacifica, Strain CCMP 1866" /LENGTH=450 /DNA_ID=CAMNT_0006537531 /DNA_START=160 /DNA_END=1512 /DNA_ORIENTATION=-